MVEVTIRLPLWTRLVDPMQPPIRLTSLKLPDLASSKALAEKREKTNTATSLALDSRNGDLYSNSAQPLASFAAS